MPTESISQRIRDAIVAVLQTITVANGYWNDVAAVLTRNVIGQSFLQTPMLGVIFGDESKRTLGRETHCEQIIEIEAWRLITADEADDTDLIIGRLNTDVSRALMADRYLGLQGLIDMIWIREIENGYKDQLSENWAGSVLRVVAPYRHSWTDPGAVV